MLTIQSNVSLTPYHTFSIDVSARYFVEVASEQDIYTLFHLPMMQSLPRLILGGGSNILFTQDFNGIVIKVNIEGIDILKEDNTHVWVRAGAGESWHKFVLYCIEKNLSGLENLSLIPGTVGAAPIQNIGAYGVELKDCFDKLEALNIQTGEKKIFDYADCKFGYRDSVFKNELKGEFIITYVTFKLAKTPTFKTAYGDIQKTLDQMNIKELSIKAVSDAVIKIRRSKLPDPAELGNAGSFFKNPEISIEAFQNLQKFYPEIPHFVVTEKVIKIPAGWFIEQCGWKGKKLGSVGVHTRQALVLVNYGGAKGLEIKQLSEKIQASVFEKFGIMLHPEVNMI